MNFNVNIFDRYLVVTFSFRLLSEIAVQVQVNRLSVSNGKFTVGD